MIGVNGGKLNVNITKPQHPQYCNHHFLHRRHHNPHYLHPSQKFSGRKNLGIIIFYVFLAETYPEKLAAAKISG